jgi:hypothetical protein
MAWNLLETWKEVDLQSSTSLEELLSNGADSGEKIAMQQKPGGKENVVIGRQVGGGGSGLHIYCEPSVTRLTYTPSLSTYLKVLNVYSPFLTFSFLWV